MGSKYRGPVSHAHPSVAAPAAEAATPPPTTTPTSIRTDNGAGGCIRDLQPPPFQLCAVQTDPDFGLHDAVSRGDIGSILYALLGGQPIDSLLHGLQPIHIAATQEDPAVIEVLVQNGADVNAQTESPASAFPSARRQPNNGDDNKCDNMSSRDGNVRHQQQQQYRRGIRSRGSFSFLRDTPTIGPISSPLSCTSGLYAMQVASDSFVDNAAPAYSGDGYCGATPLHFAIANCRVECTETLIRNGARKDIADSYGNTPESLAVICGDNAIAALLLDLADTDTAEPMSTFRTQRPAPISVTGVVPLGLALQLPSPDPSDVCFAEMLSDSPLFPAWGTAAVPNTPETPTAVMRRQTDPAVKTGAESGGSNRKSAPATSPVLPRRHTAGEAESRARQIERPVLSPATSMWAMSRFRDTSPIGIRALSASQSQRESLLLRQGSSEHLASERRFRNSADKVAVPKRRPKHANYNTSVLNGGNNSDDNVPLAAIGQSKRSQFEIVPRLRTPGRLVGLAGGGDEARRSSTLSRNSSANSRRERSYTDSVIDKAWRNYLEEYTDDDGYDDSSEMVKRSRAQHDPLAGDWSRPVPEPWMWRQAAMAIRNRRSQSLSANHHRQTRIEQKRAPF